MKHYVAAGNNVVIPDNPFSYFPSLPHSLMRAGIEITGGSLRLCRMLSGAVMAISLAAILQIIKQCGKKKSLLIGVAAILSPITLVLARANYAEQYILLFGIAGTLSIFDYRKKPIKCAILTAIFAAAALSVKLTGGCIVILLGILWLALAAKKRVAMSIFSGAAVFLLFCLPFFLRAMATKGNPFYPFLDSFFSSETARLLVSEHHHLLGSYRYGMGLLSGICYGWLFTAFDAKIFDGITSGWQLPILLLFNLFATVYLYKTNSLRRKISLLLLVSLSALYLFWAATSQQSRFMLPILMLAALAGSFNIKGLPRKAGIYCIAAIFISALIPFPQAHLKHFVTAWKIMPSIEKNPLHFLAAATRDKGYFEVVEFLKTTPEKSRVLLLLNERRTLYLPRKAVIGEPYFQERNTPVPKTSEQLFDNIKSFDYILVSTSNHNPDAQQSTSDELLKLAGMISELSDKGKIQLVFSDKSGEYLIFRCGETATGVAL